METVLYRSENRIAYVTLNRPQLYNAMDGHLLKDLLGVIEKIEHSNDRVVVITGAGAAFSAGGDVSMMGSDALLDGMEDLMDLIHEITIRWFSLKKIVISAVHGSAAGLGLSLALNADIVIAETEAKLGMLFAGVGFVPDGGGHYFLQKRLGMNRAKQFIWSMKQVKANEAKQMGLIDEVTTGDVLQAANELAQHMSFLPFDAVLATKNIYRQEEIGLIESILRQEKQAQIELAKGENHREGVRAFLEKRQPRFV